MLKHTDLVKLKAGLVAGHPTTGAYSADDATALGEVTALNLPGAPDVSKVREYCRSNEFKGRLILGSLKIAALSSPGALLPFGGSASVPADLVMSAQHIIGAHILLDVMDATASPPNLLDSAFDESLQDLVSAGVMGGADKTAIQALSSNQTNHAQQLGIGRVRLGDVTAARALP